MKTKLLLCTAMLTAFSTTVIAQTQTGRQLDIIAIDEDAEFLPVPSLGEAAAGILFRERPIVGIFWDERCASVEYTFNSNAGANPGTATEIAPDVLAATVQTGLDRWNDNPSAYIEMNVTNVTDLGARPRIGGDFINEVTFITPVGFTALASSPSFSLTQDDTFVTGEDLDGDGDSDVFDPVAAGRNTCFDFDNDGDIEFPAGDYAAGTIMDNDVQFSSTVLWETTPTATPGAADVDAVSTHEFGHSHGLSHAITNQNGPEDGSGSTMFPFIATAEPDSEFETRTPSADDLGASANIYQEGNGTTPISQIQAGDIAFDEAYTFISGTASTATGTPLTGAAVTVVDFRTGNVAGQTYSGTTVAFESEAGGLSAFAESAASGEYSVPVLQRGLYTAEIEALDGTPIATGNVSTGAIISGILGLDQFPDEAIRRGRLESTNEVDPLTGNILSARGSFGVRNIDVVANTETVQRTSGPITFGGTGAIIGATDIVYAEMFDRDEVSALIAQGLVPVSGGAETFLIAEGASTVIFDNANLSIGTIGVDGSVTITEVLSNETDVVGQDGDIASFAFNRTRSLPFRIRRAFNRDANAQLFFTLEVNDVQSGPNSGLPLGFVGVDSNIAGTSFLGIDGGALAPFGSTFAMELRYADSERRVSPFLTRF